MSSISEETPPPPPLSEAPPSYFSRDSLDDITDTRREFTNPQFNRELSWSSSNELANERGNVEEPPPPYSPGSRLRPSNGVSDAPPSYHSLFGQIREAREQSRDNLTFLRRVGQILVNTIGCSILLVLFMSVPLTVLVIGSIFVPSCPLEPLIPVYLIVGGISGMVKNVLLIIENVVQRYSEKITSRINNTKYVVYTWRVFNLLFNLFMLAWTIAGGYWVYHIYNEVTASEYEECTELLYKFGFGIVTSSFILLLLTCFCVCCCAGICLKLNKRRRRSSEGSLPDSSEDEGGTLSGDQESQCDHDEHSSFSGEDYVTNTMTSTLHEDYPNSHEPYYSSHDNPNERYAMRFDPINTDRPPIVQYESSPYPTRHSGIRQVQQSPLDHPTSSSQHTPSSTPSTPHNPRQHTRQMNRVHPLISHPPRLYRTVNDEGYSVTEV